MTKLIIPEAVRQLQMRLKVTSKQEILPLKDEEHVCDTSDLISVGSSYFNESTQADFVLLLGSENNHGSGYLAYATPCALGEFFFCLLYP
jgi:hypothetical protein